MGWIVLAFTVLFVWNVFLTTNLITTRNESEDKIDRLEIEQKSFGQDVFEHLSVCNTKSQEALRTSKNVANFVWGRQTEPNVIENDNLGGL